jgi:hypothetical protein
MTATLSLFRPSILDPKPAHPAPRQHGSTGEGAAVAPRQYDSAREGATVVALRDRRRAEPAGGGGGTQLELRGHGPAVRDRSSERAPAPTAPMGGDRRAPEPTAQQTGRPTLDDLIVGDWEGLTAHRTVACLLCGEAMTPRYSAGPAPVGGRCRSCRTTIA